MMQNPAIIFNCHYNGLSIVQELGKNGIKCIAMDCERSIGTYSKYASYQRCPDPLNSEDEFIHFLYGFCKKLGKPVLFPTNDHWAMAISKNKKLISEVSVPVVADWNSINVLINKDLFYEIGQERNYLTPYSWDVEGVKNLNDEDFPIVAKPLFRRISSNEDLKHIVENMDRLRFNIINNKEELSGFLEKEHEFVEKLIFQEYVHGMSDSMYTVGVYANKHSEILGLFTGHKVRGYPADCGNCVVGEYMRVPEYVIENTKKIIKDLRYSGIAEFEYKKDAVTGEFKLIEVNPRSWSWIGITPACGVSLPLIAYNDLCGNKLEFTECDLNNTSVKYVKAIPDLFNCIINYKHDYPQWSTSITKWIYDVNAADRIVYAEFNAGDWIVSIKALFDALLEVRASLKTSILKYYKK